MPFSSSAPGSSGRRVSHVPLPALQGQTGVGGAASKLMSLNSKILEAQRQWEAKNVAADDESMSEDSYSSESSEAAVTDVSPEVARVSTTVPLPVPLTLSSEKRGADAASLAASSQPAKRQASDTSQRSTPMGSHIEAASQSRAHMAIKEAHRPSPKPGEWQKFHADDAILVQNGNRLQPMRGTLIPTNYKLSLPPYIYKCPDKDCIRSYGHTAALGGHFSAAHKGSAYNDNCDGTLTKVGVYRKRDGHIGRAIIVSRIDTRPDPDATSDDTEASWPSEVHIPPATRTETYEYVISFLPPHIEYDAYLAIPTIKALCDLPKQRELTNPWISFHFQKHISERMFAFAVAYIVGDAVSGPSACNVDGSSPAKRLGKECIVPPKVNLGEPPLLVASDSCIGCQYVAELFGHESKCDFKNGRIPAQTPAPRPQSKPRSRDAWAADSSYRVGSEEDGQRRTTRRSIAATNKVTLLAEEQATSPSVASPDAGAAQVSPDQLEMEPWEVAPGRIVDSTQGENIGYSNAYLTGREPVEVAEDVAFNIVAIKPGDKAKWEAHESQLRTCSVAAGKIDVQISGKKFAMGPNSVFIIRPGEACVATNKLYIDATLHCTTVKNYSLSQ